MENIKNLRDDMIAVYEELREGKIGLRDAKERANIAGKILTTAKLQMEYNVYTKSGKRIKFLDSDE